MVIVIEGETQFQEFFQKLSIPSTPKTILNPVLAKGIYRILCSCGSVYVGKTGRSVKIRLSIQNRYLSSGFLTHYTITELHHELGQIVFDKTSVVPTFIHVSSIDRSSCPAIL